MPSLPAIMAHSLPHMTPCLCRSFLENIALSRAFSAISSKVLAFLLRTIVCILSDDIPGTKHSSTCLLVLQYLFVPHLQSCRAASLNFELSLWMFWIHSEILSSFQCFAPNSCVAWKSSVRFSVYVFLKNAFRSSQFSKFLWVMATRGSPLMLVSTNLCKTSELPGFIISKAVSALEINANTSRLSPLEMDSLALKPHW